MKLSFAGISILLLLPTSGICNDAAAGIAGGGTLLKNERRISMEKESLSIEKSSIGTPKTQWKGNFKVTVE